MTQIDLLLESSLEERSASPQTPGEMGWSIANRKEEVMKIRIVKTPDTQKNKKIAIVGTL